MFNQVSGCMAVSQLMYEDYRLFMAVLQLIKLE